MSKSRTVEPESMGIDLKCKACYLSFTINDMLAKGEMVRCPRCDGYVRP